MLFLAFSMGGDLSPNFSASAENDVTNIVTFYTVLHGVGYYEACRRRAGTLRRWPDFQLNRMTTDAKCRGEASDGALCTLLDHWKCSHDVYCPVQMCQIIVIRS